MEGYEKLLHNREKFLKDLRSLCTILEISEDRLLLMPEDELDSRLDALKDRFHLQSIARILLAYNEAEVAARKEMKGACYSDINSHIRAGYSTKNSFGQGNHNLNPSRSGNESRRLFSALGNGNREKFLVNQNGNRKKGGADDDWISQARQASRRERLIGNDPNGRSDRNDDIWSMLARVCCCKCDAPPHVYSQQRVPGRSDPDVTMRSGMNEYAELSNFPSRRRISYLSPRQDFISSGRNVIWRTRQQSDSPYTPESGWSRILVDNIRTVRTPDDIIAAKRQERLLRAEGSPKTRPGRRVAAARKILNMDNYPQD